MSHSFMKLKLQSSQPTLSYRVGVFVIVIVDFVIQRYGIGIPSHSEFDMLQREKDKWLIFFNDNDNVDENLVNQI